MTGDFRGAGALSLARCLRLKVEWKRSWPIHWTQYLALPGILLLLNVIQGFRGKPTNMDLVFLVVGYLVFMKLVSLVAPGILPRRSLRLSGSRLSFDSEEWDIADVDSVMIGDRQIRIRLYRPGRQGDEFVAGSEEMPPETWASLVEMCRGIPARV